MLRCLTERSSRHNWLAKGCNPKYFCVVLLIKQTKFKNNKSTVMKRIVITLTVLFSLVSFSSFANEVKVNSKVLASFNSYFKNATEVDWTVTQNFYKADFSLNGQYVAAYYDEAGELVAITRNISSTQ